MLPTGNILYYLHLLATKDQALLLGRNTLLFFHSLLDTLHLHEISSFNSLLQHWSNVLKYLLIIRWKIKIQRSREYHDEVISITILNVLVFRTVQTARRIQRCSGEDTQSGFTQVQWNKVPGLSYFPVTMTYKIKTLLSYHSLKSSQSYARF